ncbi:NAD-P-binding protein [Cubamyces sp. BRFM 1775]|nr:NAD-P-binding protein [Cubamyces sp. BRFM 1775]
MCPKRAATPFDATTVSTTDPKPAAPSAHAATELESSASASRTELSSFVAAANKEYTEIPTTQKTWRITGSGEPAKVLKLSNDTPVSSKLKKGEVLVRVQAAALNPVGYTLMDLLPGFVLRRIHAAEYDLAGIVVNGNGTAFKTGDEVFGWIPPNQFISNNQGALAQYTRLPAENLAHRPSNVSVTQAAGFSVAGLAAYQALTDIGRLKAGQALFINGGSTAVGSFAIMIAKALGARVVVSASARNEAYVRELGADEFFDYTKSPLHEQLAAANPTPKYDVFLEATGALDPTLFVKSPAYLARRGVFISVGPQGSGLGNYASFAWHVFMRPSFMGGTNRKWKLLSVKPDSEDSFEFARMVEEVIGKIRPLVDSVFAFKDTLKAYERLMSKRATGKVVVKVDPAVE